MFKQTTSKPFWQDEDKYREMSFFFLSQYSLLLPRYCWCCRSSLLKIIVRIYFPNVPLKIVVMLLTMWIKKTFIRINQQDNVASVHGCMTHWAEWSKEAVYLCVCVCLCVCSLTVCFAAACVFITLSCRPDRTDSEMRIDDLYHRGGWKEMPITVHTQTHTWTHTHTYTMLISQSRNG